MNKIKLFVLSLVAVSLYTVTFISCSKEETSASFDESTIAKKLEFVDIKTIINKKATSKGTPQDSLTADYIVVEWDEWGRGSKHCAGWGLCNANWFPSGQRLSSNTSKKSNITGAATLLRYDKKKSKYYIDILLAKTAPSDIPLDALALKIDSDFNLDVKKAISRNLTFHQGKYSFDSSLGNFGGYRIYLD
jgi:hypothetical protein